MLRDASGFKHVFIAVGFTDLRKGTDSLALIIKNGFHLDPYEEGNLFLFCGRRTDRIKGLLYEGDGFLLLTKRLSDGHFQWPRSTAEVKELSEKQYRWLMDGLTLEPKKQIKEVHPTLI